MRVLFVGTAGRAPFTGHFRGRAGGAGTELHWAGRVHGGAAPEEGWAAAELVRDALAGVTGADRYAMVDAAWAALRTVPHGDLSVLLVARDAEGTVIAASGVAEVRADGAPVAPPGHPIYDEPGVRERPGYLHPEGSADEYVALGVGGRWPTEPLAIVCGARTA